MPKRAFWPLAMIVMGIIILAANLGLLPVMLWSLWPLILIVVGLGGLLVGDRDEWLYPTSKTKVKSKKK